MNFKKLINDRFDNSAKYKVLALLRALQGKDPCYDPSINIAREIQIEKKVIIATHHKTGTVWLGSIFKKICSFHSLKYFKGLQENVPQDFDVWLEDHSKFDFFSLGGSYRGLHIIRDPRDIIISGCFYHQKSKEPWLHRPQKKFNGLSYQEKINSFNTMEEKLFFEMENSGRDTVNAILKWNYDEPSFMNIKYEDLVQDYNLDLFHKIYNFLGFPGYAIPSLLAISFSNSIFSGNLNKTTHIRSGKSNQWQKYFTQEHKEKFNELFGKSALVDLGYESL